MIVGIYIRVSTTEQAEEGYSIPAQKERLIAYCQAQGWNEYKLYIDEGVSAKDTNRPKLKLLLKDVEEGKINLILVYRLDRFTRRVRDLHNMLDFLEKHNCKFRSATEMYDTTTAMGRMFIGLVALLAQWEAENMSERISMALEKKVADGERVGNIPYGFDLSDEKLVTNEKSKYLLWMIDKIEKGWSINHTAEQLYLINKDRNWNAEKIIRLLRNPAIYGATRWLDKIYENTHKGIITKERWLRLQKILNDRTVHFKKHLKFNYIFHGVLICPNCGHVLVGNRFTRIRKDGTEKHGFIYRCNSCIKNKRKVRNLGEKYFLEAFMEYMKDINFDNVEIKVEENNNAKELLKELDKIKKIRTRYQRGWASGNIEDDEFEVLMQETKIMQKEIEQKLEKLDAHKIQDVDSLKKIVSTFNEHFHELDREEKREFIQRFIRKIEFKIIEMPPKSSKYKKGRPKINITNIEFY